MNTKTTIPITEARKNIFAIAQAVQKPGVYYTFTENGVPKTVMMSAEEFDSWQETLEVMKDFPDLSKDIKQAEDEYKRGEYITLDQLLKEEGYILNDKGKLKYGISNRSAKKSPKRTK